MSYNASYHQSKKRNESYHAQVTQNLYTRIVLDQRAYVAVVHEEIVKRDETRHRAWVEGGAKLIAHVNRGSDRLRISIIDVGVARPIE